MISQPIRIYTNFMILIPKLAFFERRGFHGIFAMGVYLASKKRLLYRIPGSVPFLGLVYALIIETIFSTLFLPQIYPSLLSPLCLHYYIVVGCLVDCGLRSHSAIFQLYSDGTDVQFPIFDLLSCTQRHGQLGVFSVPNLPRHGHRDVRRRLLSPCHQRAHTRWG